MKKKGSFDRLFLASYGLVAVKSVNKKWTGDLGEYLQTSILRRSKGALLMNLLSYWLIFLEILDTWKGVKKMKGWKKKNNNILLFKKGQNSAYYMLQT